jgi:hypothetical protein
MKSGSVVVAAVLAAGIGAWSAPAFAQAGAQSLGTVRLAQAVQADGKPLAAGTYTVRLTGENGTPVVGQAPTSERWVEFVQGGQVRGRELASVVSSADIVAINENKSPPAAGTARVHSLRGGEYLRVWVNSGGTHYLVHLSTDAKATAAK